jgi:hypothetical protein
VFAVGCLRLRPGAAKLVAAHSCYTYTAHGNYCTTEAGKKRACMHRTWPKREAFRSDGCGIKLLGERERERDVPVQLAMELSR